MKRMTIKTTSAIACFVAAILAAPAAVNAAEHDTDRSSPKAFVKDSVITTKIKAQMARDKQVSALHIKVDTDNKGLVTLSGKARSQEEADRAVSIARGVKGVVSVENDIQVVAHR